jgi:hypothetical protein
MDMLSIREASRFVIGAAIMREMANKNSPGANITFDNVAVAALGQDNDGAQLRSSIQKLADQEAVWFRSTPPHTLATERVMQTRAQEVRTLNSVNLAVLMTLEHSRDAAEGDPTAIKTLEDSYQTAIRAIDEMPGSTTERRSFLQSLKSQVIEASNDRAYIEQALDRAQHLYLDAMMSERLAAYQSPSQDRDNDNDNDHNM